MQLKRLVILTLNTQVLPSKLYAWLPWSCYFRNSLYVLGAAGVQGEKKRETETFKPKFHRDYSCCSQLCEVVCTTVGFA